ncbi:uncharacterized protein LOC143774899 [Ranitomeya variabilis]|uniref:uncharacterized protein LOC143774899 n=1 Tax=Ranitomeya variabilis TaxID=490064 RepID=UPI00405761B7
MDFRAKEIAWRSHIDQVFGGDVSITQQATDRRWEEQVMELQNMVIKRTKLWWNCSFLEGYQNRKMIPRGLRVRVIPTFPVEDAAFISGWEEACNNCSGQLMKLLGDYNKGIIEQLDASIKVAEEELKKCGTVEQLDLCNKQIEKSLENVVKKIQDTQSSKIGRDRHDYECKRVYLWRKSRQGDGQMRRAQSQSSISSVSDTSERSTSSVTTRSRMTTRNQRDFMFHPYRRDDSSTEPRKYNNKVINLSSHDFTDIDLELLEKGLSFSPAAPFDVFEAVKDLHLFARSLIFKKYFFDGNLAALFPTEEEQIALRTLEELAVEHDTPEGGMIPTSIRSRSKKFPPLSSCPNVDLFVQLVTKDFQGIPKHIYKDNLTAEERGRLRVLQDLGDVVFKPADKGGNVVVWPNSMYEKEAYRQLNNKVCYKKLTFNPLSAFSKQLGDIVKQARDAGTITNELASALLTSDSTIPTFYLLPKIHKDTKTPPGRPIISGRGNYLEKVNQWIDSKLQPLVLSLPSYLKDTGEFLRLMDGVSLGDEELLVTADVESLYTSIRHSDGLRAVKFFLDASNSSIEIKTLICDLLEFSLTHNFFVFKGSFFLQLQGTAMAHVDLVVSCGIFHIFVLRCYEEDISLTV